MLWCSCTAIARFAVDSWKKSEPQGDKWVEKVEAKFFMRSVELVHGGPSLICGVCMRLKRDFTARGFGNRDFIK
jgi:hypothetical protein